MARRSIPPSFRALLAAGVALVLGAAAVTVTTAQAAATLTPTVPDSMSALGDSITRGFDSCGWWQDCPNRSWTTGGEAAVSSHYARIRTKNATITGRAYNDAKSGARIAELDAQARAAVSRRAGYVTILIGANDACTGTESGMTPVPTFETRFRAAMTTLTTGLPAASILVVSIPDLKRLWYVGKNSWAAQQVWGIARICQSMLARPTSLAAADGARRDRVRQRVIDYNRVLGQVCGEYPRCRFDGNAVFSYQFSLGQLSTWDYFHPNQAGQATLARLSYQAGFNW